MPYRFLKFALAVLLGLSTPALALDGQPGMHDPSTIILHNGRSYSYGTGNGLPISVSDDGWTWRREGSLMSAAPGGRGQRAALQQRRAAREVRRAYSHEILDGIIMNIYTDES